MMKRLWVILASVAIVLGGVIGLSPIRPIAPVPEYGLYRGYMTDWRADGMEPTRGPDGPNYTAYFKRPGYPNRYHLYVAAKGSPQYGLVAITDCPK